ncbi:MAG: hypothetical protein A2458_04650 [Candidatus Kerfeldbacteria bacterium RIFOXYC2_FULL_38_9]|nr:MAG: hypothetical protein A2458_04650 [Candidatus Kerfeldbacteria bacterium RIFOXYC2_FULL_38_9]
MFGGKLENQHHLFLKMMSAVLFVFLGLTGGWSVQAASVEIANGTITYPNSSPASGIAVEIHNGNASVHATATTDINGVYSLSLDENEANGESLAVEFTVPTGYMSPTNEENHFNYTIGDSVRAIDFELIATTKTINVTVTTIDGEPVQYVDVGAAPVGGVTHTQSSGSMTNGVGALYVTGGRWVVKASRNLSEQNPTRYPWVNISPAQEVTFADNDTAESVDLTFQVVPSQQLVTVKPVDENGDILTENSFNGDVYLIGYTKYGPVSTFAKVNGETGIASLYLLPGIYKLNAQHNQLSGQSFDPEARFIVGADPGTYDWGTVQATRNSSSLSGTASIITIDQNGTETTENRANVLITATNLDFGIAVSTNTQNDGSFNFQNIAPGTYTVEIDNNQYLARKTAYTKVASEESMTDLELQAVQTNITLSGSVVDGSDVKITDLPAAVVVNTGDEKFYGAVDPDGNYSVSLYGTEGENATLNLVTQKDTTIFQDEDINITLHGNNTQNITTNTNEGTINGNIIKNTTGENLTASTLGTDNSVVALNMENGSYEETDVQDDGSFSLNVGPGNWKVMPKIDALSTDALTGVVSDQAVEVTADQVVDDVEVPVAVVDGGSVNGKILDADGNPVAEARVVLSNAEYLQEQATANNTSVNPEDIISLVAKTDSAGEFNQGLPDGNFRAYFGNDPEGGTGIAPEIMDFSVEGGAVDLADAGFRNPDTTVSGEINSEIKNAKVEFYSETGGLVETSVDANNNYNAGLTEGTWQAVVSGVNADNKIAIHQEEVVVGSENVDLNFDTLTDTAVEMPSTSQVTCDVSESCIVGNDAGARAQLPPYAAGFDGEITVQLIPNPNIEVGSGGIVQEGVSYDVKVWDGNSTEVTLLERPAIIEIPLDENLKLNNAETEELTPSFQQEDVNMFLAQGVMAETDGNIMRIHTTHLTKFAAVAVGRTTTTEDDVAPLEKPNKPRQLKTKKIKAHSALLTWYKPLNSTVDTYKVQLRKYKIKKQKNWKNYNNITLKKKAVKKLKKATRYQFRVKACNSTGCSAYTKWKKFKTKGVNNN